MDGIRSSSESFDFKHIWPPSGSNKTHVKFSHRYWISICSCIYRDWGGRLLCLLVTKLERTLVISLVSFKLVSISTTDEVFGRNTLPMLPFPLIQIFSNSFLWQLLNIWHSASVKETTSFMIIFSSISSFVQPLFLCNFIYTISYFSVLVYFGGWTPTFLISYTNYIGIFRAGNDLNPKDGFNGTPLERCFYCENNDI